MHLLTTTCLHNKADVMTKLFVWILQVYNFDSVITNQSHMVDTLVIMLIMQVADFLCNVKFIDTFSMYKIIKTNLQVSHLSVSNLKT